MVDGYRAPTRQNRRWVENALGSGTRVLRAMRLTGGLTSWMDRLTVRTASGDAFDVVLRRWPDDSDWPNGLARQEADALSTLAGHDVPAPRLLAVDETGRLSGSRSVLMTLLPGTPLLTPSDPADFVRRLAHQLAHIHQVCASLEATDPFGFDAEADRGWLGDPGLARAATDAAVSGDRDAGGWVLAHGDYQHFNVLWRDERLTGVVDWTMAGQAPRGLDIGHCRLNLAVLFSADVAERFLTAYEAEAGVTVSPRSDLRGLLGFAPVWREFIPLQVAGRAPVDGPGMAGRVTELVRAALARLDG